LVESVDYDPAVMGLRPSLPLRFAALVGSLILVACERDQPTVEESPPPGAISERRSTYTYERFGVTAVLQLGDSGGSLDVTNRTGSTLGRPAIVVLDASHGRPHAMEVAASAPIASAGSGTFAVPPHGRLDPARIGLILLSFGPDVYGALIPSAGPP
jgi:hypothetical protein